MNFSVYDEHCTAHHNGARVKLTVRERKTLAGIAAERLPQSAASGCNRKRRAALKHSSKAEEKVADPADLQVGIRIGFCRSILNMSRARLADGPGIAFQQSQKCDMGINRIGASRLQNIAKFLSTREDFELGRSFAEVKKDKTRKLLLPSILAPAG